MKNPYIKDFSRANLCFLEIRIYQRARILLLKSEGASNEAIVYKLDIGISVESKKELEDRIYRYSCHWIGL